MPAMATRESERPASVGFQNAASGAISGVSRQAILVRSNAQLGLWTLLATVTMLFAGFTSTYLVRRAGADWQPVSPPTLLWLNTLVIICSSGTLEIARSYQRRLQMTAVKGWLSASAVLGVIFLVGQVLAWRQLVALGIYVPTSAHSSFFYMLTAIHALHVLGGIGALLYALVRVRRFSSAPMESNVVGLCATYWHFVAWIWLYLFVLLFIWK